MARNLKPERICRFMGMASWPSVANVPPDYALECVNVIPSSSGAMAKLRGGKILAEQLPALQGLGNIAQFQSALGIRQLIAAFGYQIYRYTLDAFSPLLIDHQAENNALMDFVQANNLMFLANGLRTSVWDGSSLRPWGIWKPATAPIVNLVNPGGLANPIVAPTVNTQTQGSLPVRNYSVTFTLVAVLGETLQSPPTDLAVAAGDTVRITVPDLPSGALGWNCYIDLKGATDRRKMNDVPLVNGVQFDEPITGFSCPTLAPVVGVMTTGFHLARTYSISMSYVSSFGETFEGPAISVFLQAGETPLILNTATGPLDAIAWNCYVDIHNGTDRRLQNATPLALNSPLREPDTGFVDFYNFKPSINTASLGREAPTLNATGGALTLAVGRRYRAAYANSLSGHIGQASVASESTGPVTLGTAGVWIDRPTDPLLDRIWLFASLDGDETFYYLRPNPASVDGSWAIGNVANPTVAPIVGEMAGGALALRNYGVVYTLVTVNGETLQSPATVAPISAARVAVISLPAGVAIEGAVGWNLYVDILGGTAYTKQNATVVPFNSAVTEAVGGFTNVGAAPPAVGTVIPGTSIVDNMPDDELNQAIDAPILNAPPPMGKYLVVWQGRIYMAGMADAKQDVAYSGYERIRLGRPEETFPPNNRLRLAIGSDDVRGLGAVQAGIIVFSKSNEMFMLRGDVEDIVTDEIPRQSAFLEELPWNQGCASHYSIVNTPYGLVWLGSDLTIKLWKGVGEPQTLSTAISPLLRRIAPGQEENARAVFYCQQEREWYMLLISVTEGLPTSTAIIVIDLDPNPERNVGAFPLYFQCDAIEVVEDANGRSKVIVMALGSPYELLVQADTTGGITVEFASTEMTLLAYWRSGYFGIDNPMLMKFFRYCRLVTDQQGFRIKLYLVDDETYTFRNPQVMDFQSADSVEVPIDTKARRVSVEIQFPMADVPANVLELVLTHFPLSYR